MNVMATVKRSDEVRTEQVTLEPVGSWLRIVIPRTAVLTLARKDVLEALGVQPAGRRKAA